MYLVDSGSRVVHAFSFEPGTGTISDGRELVTVPEDVGTPDGLTVDTNGDIWVAIFTVAVECTVILRQVNCAKHCSSLPHNALPAGSPARNLSGFM